MTWLISPDDFGNHINGPTHKITRHAKQQVLKYRGHKTVGKAGHAAFNGGARDTEIIQLLRVVADQGIHRGPRILNFIGSLLPPSASHPADAIAVAQQNQQSHCFDHPPMRHISRDVTQGYADVSGQHRNEQNDKETTQLPRFTAAPHTV